MTPQQDQLRTTLRRVADDVTPLPVADDLWQRGQSARRRGRALVVAAVLAIIASVTWSAVLLGDSDRDARTASAPAVPGGAIPSRIEDPGDLPLERDLALGRASVAFISAADRPVVIDATDGSYHALALDDAPEDGGQVALSPDGRFLAWSNHGRIHTMDFEDGLPSYYGSDAEHADVTALRWTPDSLQLVWEGADEGGTATAGIFQVGDVLADPIPSAARRGILSPTGDLIAVASDGTVDAAPFLRRRGKPVDRALPEDLYPDGAQVRPLGWTEPDLVLAYVDAPAGSYVEGRHVALFTSPDRPASEWTYRIVMRDLRVPADISLAVDLIPDLDGTSSQQLTHDFGGSGSDDDPLAPMGIELSLFIGLGVAAAIAVLMVLRWLWRRLLG